MSHHNIPNSRERGMREEFERVLERARAMHREFDVWGEVGIGGSLGSSWAMSSAESLAKACAVYELRMGSLDRPALEIIEEMGLRATEQWEFAESFCEEGDARRAAADSFVVAICTTWLTMGEPRREFLEEAGLLQAED